MVVEKEFTFIGIKIIDYTLIPVEWTLELYMLGDDSKVERTKIVFQKIVFWIDSLLNGIVALNANDDFSLLLASETENSVMSFPDIPTEDVMIQMIYEKLKMLSEGCLIFEQIKLYCNDSDVTYSFRPDSNDRTTLPDISYMQLTETKFKEPWWKRATSDMNDFNYQEDVESDNSVHDMKNISEDILITFEKELLKSMSAVEETEATVIDIFDKK